MNQWVWLILGGAVHAAVGCGGETAKDSSPTAAGGAAASGYGSGGRPFMGAAGAAAEGGTGSPQFVADYEDPGCPDAGGPEVREECDPFSPAGECGVTEACVPFVEYPLMPCDREIYGTRCEPAGGGTQGDACTEAACSAGFACVVTGEGTQCVRLCHVAAHDCPSGMFCEPIDVQPGLGGCY